MKQKNIKKILGVFMVFAFVASLVPVQALNVNACEDDAVTKLDETDITTEDDLLGDITDDEIDEIDEAVKETAMVNFTARIRWGNVIEEPIDISEENFDGGITVSDDARVSLERTLLFEDNNGSADDITSEMDPVSWNSLAYSHWDGVIVAVSSPANEDITINAGNESLTMTAKELYDASEQIVVDGDENGKEIVINIYPAAKHPSIFMKVFWGKIDQKGYAESRCAKGTEGTNKCTIPLLNADGSLSINNSGKLKLIKPLRFEFPDKILSKSNTQIEWSSRLYGGIDGVLVKLKLNANELDSSDELTLMFDQYPDNFPKSYSILDLYHNRYTEDVINGRYGVVFQVWRRPNKSLIRIDREPMVYEVEDGVKRPIPSEQVLYSQGLTFDDVAIIDKDEADTYADGDYINYADGTIVREDGTKAVYVVENGEKKHIKDPASFEDLGYSWDNIVKVKPGVLELFREGVALKSNSIHPEGALIRVDGNPKVYVIEGGKRVPISDIQLFNARRYDWNKVLVVNENQANKFEIGTSLKYPDGSILKDKNGKVFKVDQGKKRWIRSDDDFIKAGYKESDILEVENDVVEDLESGIDIIADDVLE